MKIQITADSGEITEIEAEAFAVVAFQKSGIQEGDGEEYLRPVSYVAPENQAWVPVEAIIALATLLASATDDKLEVLGRAVIKTIQMGLGLPKQDKPAG